MERVALCDMEHSVPSFCSPLIRIIRSVDIFLFVVESHPRAFCSLSLFSLIILSLYGCERVHINTTCSNTILCFLFTCHFSLRIVREGLYLVTVPQDLDLNTILANQ